MNGVNYLLQTNLYLMLFMGFYVLVLRNETFFRQNRIYLNTSIFLSFGIPFMNTDWFRDLFITQRVRESAIIPSQQMYEIIIVDGGGSSSWSAADIVLGVYTAGALIFLIRFFIRLAVLRSTLKPAKGSAFSFFNILVVDRDLPEAATIIDHEKVHMRQLHSADIILIELAAIVNWFNPVMYLYKKEIRHIHEFIADEEAASMMPSKSDYALLLFSNTLGIHPSQLSNSFFNKSLLKRRIVMLNKNKSRSTGLWKYGFSAPLFILMLIVSASAVKSEETLSIPVPQTVVNPVLGLAADTATKDPNIMLTTVTLNEPRTVVSPDSKSKKEASAASMHSSFNALKKYLSETLTYPARARENKITGHVLVKLTVRDHKLNAVAIEKGLQNDIDEDVVRSLNKFTGTLAAENGVYTLSLVYIIFDQKPEIESLNLRGLLDKANHLGTVLVSLAESGETKNGYDKTIDAQNKLPEFPGGMKGWGEYLQNNLKYPAQARADSTQGRVILSFVVEKDGSLSEIKVLRGVGGGLDEEAIRVLTTSPLWKPGIEDGRPVRVAYTMPIVFRLQPKPAEQTPATESTN